MNGIKSAAAWILPSMDVLISLLALSALLPIAGGLPSIASQGQPLIDGIWFAVNLAGALLLLAGGMKLLFRRVRPYLFVLLYVAFIAALGTLRLHLVGFQRLIGGWLVMTLFVAGLLLILRIPLRWILTGIIWCVLLLGLWAVGGVVSFLSTETQQLSPFLPLQILAFVFVLVLLGLHLRYRGSLPSGFTEL
jgi:hypothetical protein